MDDLLLLSSAAVIQTAFPGHCVASQAVKT
jgi:hypothetical protein